jgi:hypothetical protein
MTRDDAVLFVRWVSMASPLICAGEPIDAVTANLAAQMRQDLGGRDDSGVCELLPLFVDAMREVGELTRLTLSPRDG